MSSHLPPTLRQGNLAGRDPTPRQETARNATSPAAHLHQPYIGADAALVLPSVAARAKHSASLAARSAAAAPDAA
jgi:hypothetical protein